MTVGKSLTQRKDLTFVKGRGYVSKSKLSSSKSKKSTPKKTYDVRDTETGELIRTTEYGTDIGDVKLQARAKVVSKSPTRTVSREEIEKRKDVPLSLLQRQEEIKKPSEQISTSIQREILSAPSDVRTTSILGVQQDIFGRPVLQSTIPQKGKIKKDDSVFLGPTQRGIFAAPTLISEPKKTKVERKKLEVFTSTPSKQKEFLKSVAKDAPSAFEQYALGEAGIRYAERITPEQKFQTYGTFEDVGQKGELTIPGKKIETLRLVTTKKQPSEEEVVRGLAEFENTKLKNQQLNKQIQEFNLLPVTQQDERELRNLEQQRTDIDSRFRLNPFVEEKNGTFVFTSPVTSPVLVEQKTISQAEDIFIPEPRTQFGKGFKEALAGEGKYVESFREASLLGKIERGKGMVAGAIVSPFIGAKGAKEITFKAVGQPLTKIGVSKPSAERVSEASLGIVSTVALAPLGGALGKGAAFVATKLPKVAAVSKTAAVAGKVAVSKPAQVALGGLLLADVGLEAKKGYEETGTVGGALTFGAAEAGELAAWSVPISSGIKGFKSVKAVALEREAAKAAKGEGIDVILSKGVGTTITSPKSPTVRAVSESEGIIKVGGKDIKVKIFTGAEGRQTISGPEQLDDILRITGGKVKVEFPKSIRKSLEFETFTDLKKLPSGNIEGTTIITDAAGKESILKTITGKKPGIKGTELQETIGVTAEKPGLLPGEITELGKTVTFKKPATFVSTPKGEIIMTETEFATGSLRAEPGKSLTETLKALVRPPQIAPKIQAPISPVTKPTITPIGEPIKPIIIPGRPTKTPLTTFQRGLQQKIKPVARTTEGISETQTLATTEKLKRLIGEQRATKLRTQAIELGKTVPAKTTLTPITTMEGLRQLQIKKSKTLVETKQKMITPTVMSDIIKSQIPIMKSAQVTIQEPIMKPVQETILTPIQEVIPKTAVSEVITPKPEISIFGPGVIPGVLGAGGLGLPGAGGVIKTPSSIMGVKINPIASISKGIGKSLRKIK